MYKEKICIDADKKLESFVEGLSQEVSHHRMVEQKKRIQKKL